MIPIIIDVDGSAEVHSGTARLDFSEVQESLRYGCSWPGWRAFENKLRSNARPEKSIAYLGSGDLHHLSYGLIKTLPVNEQIEVLVIDNHPDNMRFPFGIHCGSWVYHAAKLPQVKRVTVAGITSEDIRGWHTFENHFLPLFNGKIAYVALRQNSVQKKSSYLPGVTELTRDKIVPYLSKLYKDNSCQIYLSIDKDALSPSVITTDWDQGILDKETLIDVIKLVAPKLTGADVTGELSPYTFSTGWKRLLTRFDGRQVSEHKDLDLLKQQQQNLNLEILESINSSR